MISRDSRVAGAYFEHFTEDDRALLAGLQSSHLEVNVTQLPATTSINEIESLLGSECAFKAVFASQEVDDSLSVMSPFLVFAVAIHHAAQELNTATYVTEWLGPGHRIPLFGVDQLHAFMSSPWHRLFLIELLASYTHVASGSVVVPTRRGLRRQRFSELDPVRLASLLEVVSDAERPGILRRIGDLALFLTGVFPDHTARHGFSAIDEGRLRRVGRYVGPTNLTMLKERDIPGFGDRGAVDLLEQLGRRCYQSSFDLLPQPISERGAVLGEMPTQFREARRMLGFVTERYLFPNRDRWFGLSAG